MQSRKNTSNISLKKIALSKHHYWYAVHTDRHTHCSFSIELTLWSVMNDVANVQITVTQLVIKLQH